MKRIETIDYEEIFPSLNTVQYDSAEHLLRNEDEENNFDLSFQASSSGQCHNSEATDNRVSLDSLVSPQISAFQTIQEKWYQNYSIPGDTFVDPNKPEARKRPPDLPVGEVLPAVSVVGWSPHNHNVDIRPRLWDKSSGEARLLDSGAQISATKRLPGDKINNSMRLIAVNGSQINTYGVRKIELKINRKAYTINAVICDINQDILGIFSSTNISWAWIGQTTRQSCA